MAKSNSGESKPSRIRRRTEKAPVPQAPATAADSVRTLIPQAASGPNALEVQRRAYELFLQRGGTHGQDLEDWYEAERQLRGQRKALLRA